MNPVLIFSWLLSFVVIETYTPFCLVRVTFNSTCISWLYKNTLSSKSWTRALTFRVEYFVTCSASNLTSRVEHCLTFSVRVQLVLVVLHDNDWKRAIESCQRKQWKVQQNALLVAIVFLRQFCLYLFTSSRGTLQISDPVTCIFLSSGSTSELENVYTNSLTINSVMYYKASNV